MFLSVVKTLCVVAFMLAVSRLLYSWYLNSSRRALLATLDLEINRARRAGRRLGFLLLKLPLTVPANLQGVLPGQMLTVQTIRRSVRATDLIKRIGYRLCSILLTETREADGPQKVRQRLLQVADEYTWPAIKIGFASFPDDAETAKELIDIARKSGDID